MPNETKRPKLMKSHLNAIERIRALGFKEPAEPQPRRNPYTGLQHTLEPLAVMLYDFITTRTLVCGKDFTRQTWDNARYCFNIQWPREYYDLLD
jgi:hypothetical protein